jgi:glycosyltransferase involved in cell wall biosynthesis
MDMMHDRSPPANARDFDLLIAAHFVYAGRVGGAEQMLYNLVAGLATFDATTTLLCGDARNLAPGFVSQVVSWQRVQLRETGGTASRFVAEQRACLDPSLTADAILFPNYFLPPVTPRRLGRTGIVLHDLQYRHFPDYFTRKKRAWLHVAQKWAIHRADRVFVISDFVRRDVLRCFGAKHDKKLVVAPNPISWSRFDADGAQEQRPLEAPYILSVAAQYAHKNLETLIRGFGELAKRDNEIRLVLCGQDHAALHGVGGVKVGLRPLIEHLGLTGRIILTGYLDDASLGRWYRHAGLFAFPSVFEGFGMPPVEALGFGLPVLTSGLTALPETTLGLACVVDDATNPQAWSSAMSDMLRRGDAGRLNEAQVAQVRGVYSPIACAERYLDGLRR